MNGMELGQATTPEQSDHDHLQHCLQGVIHLGSHGSSKSVNDSCAEIYAPRTWVWHVSRERPQTVILPRVDGLHAPKPANTAHL
jgi:hypothetical protein